MKDENIDQGRRQFFKETFSFMGNKIHEVVKNKIDLTTQEKPATVFKTTRFIRPLELYLKMNFSLCARNVMNA